MNEKERCILRELAAEQQELANSVKNQQCIQEWYRHNPGKAGRPMIHIEMYGFFIHTHFIITAGQSVRFKRY